VAERDSQIVLHADSTKREDMSDNAGIEVGAVINDSPISRFQYVIFAICILITMCDGFDIQAAAYTAPSIACEWQLAVASFGPVFAAVLLGSMFGAFVFGQLGDSPGRKRILAMTVVLFSSLNTACAYAPSITPLIVMRFLCGFALGGALPSLMALVAICASAKAIHPCCDYLGRVLAGSCCRRIDQRPSDFEVGLDVGIHCRGDDLHPRHWRRLVSARWAIRVLSRDIGRWSVDFPRHDAKPTLSNQQYRAASRLCIFASFCKALAGELQGRR
jgi:hypothetical protein